jgi:hypothetical protein
MLPEIKAKWVAALRSGEYRQGQAFLRQEVDGVTCHCCLGVLLEVTMPEKLDEEDRSDIGEELSAEEREILQLPASVQQALVCMNDGLEGFEDNSQPFPAIALWIERYL